MTTKIEQKILTFNTLEFGKKRELCLIILSEAKSSRGLFEELFNLVSSNKASEQELTNIYQSAIMMLENIDETIRQESINILEKARDNLKQVILKEQQEREQEIKNSNILLSSLI